MDRVIEVEIVSAAPHGPGTLVLSWFTPAEADALRRDGVPPPASIVPFISRSRTVACTADALLAGLRIEIPVSGAAVPFAVLDSSRALWAGLIDGGGTNPAALAAAPAEAGRTALTLRAPAPKPRGEPAVFAAPRFHRRVLGHDGDGKPYAAMVCLPPPERMQPGRRFPAVYLLPGLGGNETVRFSDRGFVERIDARATATGRDAILVGISTRTAYGSSYLADAGWRRFVARDVVVAVDAEFPTLAEPTFRVLAGQSTGGFNALTVALTEPGTYGGIVAAAPDAPAFADWLLTPDGAIRPAWLAWMRLEDAVGGPGQMLSLARNWSPRPGGGYDWPADLATGAVRPAVLERWLRHDPLRLLAAPEGAAALRALDGRLQIGVAGDDEFGLYPPTRRFADALAARGIAHRFVADTDGHLETQARLTGLIAAALDAMPPA